MPSFAVELVLTALCYLQAVHDKPRLALRASIGDAGAPWRVNWNCGLVKTTIVGAAAVVLWRRAANGFRLPE